MNTTNFNIFKEMVELVKTNDLKYLIMYSYNEIDNGNYPYIYSFVLSTELFTVTFKKKLEDNKEILKFLRDNECIELNCDMKIDKDSIELN